MNRKYLAAGVALVVILALGIGIFLFAVKNGNRTRILVLLPTLSNPYWLDVKRGAESAGIELGDNVDVRVEAGQEDADAGSQVDLMKSFLGQRAVDALVLGPASAAAPVPMVKRYNESGIPVMVIDSKLSTKELEKHSARVDATLVSDNKGGGRLAAKELENILGFGQKSVLILKGSEVHETAHLRTDGFVEAAPKDWNLEIKIADWRGDRAQEIMASYLAGPHIDGVFANSDEMAVGAASALRNGNIAKENWPEIIGFDATEDGLKLISSGEMHASIKQDANRMGYEGVMTAWKLFMSDPGVVKNRKLPVHLVKQ